MIKHTFKLPPQQKPAVLIKSKQAYCIWHQNLINLARVDRYTIGAKIDETFLALLELIFKASFACDKFEKLSLVIQAIGKNDLLGFLLQISWEQKVIDHSSYGSLILCLEEIGKMLGGWKKNLKAKTPTNR